MIGGMVAVLSRLLSIVVFLVAWWAASAALMWCSNYFLLETRDLAPDQVPRDFSVVVEEARVADAPTSYRYQRLQDLRERPLAAGESLHLSTPAHEFPGSCCYAFTVIEDGADGQVIEFDAEDMSYLRSRYRVHQGQVTALAFRRDYSLYYLGYLVTGGLIAGLATSRLRRRIRAGGGSKLPVIPLPPGSS